MAADDVQTTIRIDPTPLHPLSPGLYMQFMEPLGTTDSSVEAAWDIRTDAWRADVVEAVRDLAPGAIRWGGIFTSYWRWREGIGPAEARRPMLNYLWGGTETNRVGVHEILGFCEAVGAGPILAVNFAADGRPEYIETACGERRAGTAEEAADLVAYCNDGTNPERAANGRTEPWGVKLWQVGNETSYPPAGRRFTGAENARQFRLFAEAMKSRDPGIRLIAWGDMERPSGPWWAPELIREAGEHVDLVALHMMQQRPARDDTVLKGTLYRQDYDRSWAELGEIYAAVARKLEQARQVVREASPTARLAITEGHLSLQPHNKSAMLREWIAGLYAARLMALYERNADMVEVATLADFMGTTWTVNAVMLGSPAERPYLLPVGHVMRLFRRHGGSHGIAASASDGSLEVSASRRGDTVFLHVVNTDLRRECRAAIVTDAGRLAGGTAHVIAPPVSVSIDSTALGVFDPATLPVPDAPTTEWTFPKASVTVLELKLTGDAAG